MRSGDDGRCWLVSCGFGFYLGKESFEFACLQSGDELGIARSDLESVERGGEVEVVVEAHHLAVLRDLSESSAECVGCGLGFALRGERPEIHGVVYLAE